MSVQTFIVLLILGVATICDGASFSNVYVEGEVVPMAYYAYGAPYPSIPNLRLSDINSLPSVPGYVAPCGSPCVYSAPTVATVTPTTPSPNVLAYNAKNVPVVAAPAKQEATGYEYSYVVYDDNTGDHKAQREHSDGSVVRGEYSFLQPDGYIRKVQYVADDISGFNAVVKNVLPVAVETKNKVEEQENKESPPPCHETKNESLKERSEEGLEEISIKQLKKIHEILHVKHSNEESAEKPKEHLHSKSKESGEEEHSKDKHHKETEKVSKEASGEESGEESDSEESKEELKEKSLKKSSKETEGLKEKNKSQKGSKETVEDSEAESEEKVSHGKNKEVHELLKPTDETLVPYKDILRCLEAAMKRNYGVPVAMRQGPSPLTYIVLNKPC